MKAGGEAAPSAGEDGAGKRQERRRVRLFMLSLIAGSYAVDTLLLALFAWAGSVPLILPIAFGIAALAVNGLFLILLGSGFSERSRDHNLSVWQMAAAASIQLACLFYFPELAFFFLNVLFVVFLFASLRLPARHSVVTSLLVSAATAAVMSQIWSRIGMPHATAAEGALVWLSYTLTLVRCLYVGYYGSMLRIMMRKLNSELERRVAQRTQQLEHSNRELREAYDELEAFSYSVAHDLRNPLRGINGFCSILAEDYADKKLDAEAQGHLQRIRKGTERLGTLIDALLDLARVSRARPNMEDVDMSAMAHELAAALDKTDPKRNVEFVIAAGLAARADRKLLRVVLENLFGNAWKFTSRKEKARIEFGEETTGGKTAYFVRDNGIGFDATFGSKLFGQFQRLHVEQDYEGTGIGLALVERIVRHHSGQVWAEGAVGQGATFYFTLP